VAVSFKIPPGTTDKNIESVLDKLQNAIQKFGTDVDAQSVEVENKKEVLNGLATTLYDFDIQLQDFVNNFSANTKSQTDDADAANIRTKVAEFQNKLINGQFSIEEANTLITDLAEFFGQAVTIYENEFPSAEEAKKTIEEAKEAEEKGAEEEKPIEEKPAEEKTEEEKKETTSSARDLLNSFLTSIEEIKKNLLAVNKYISRYMATDPGKDPWNLSASQQKTIEIPLIESFKTLGESLQDSSASIEKLAAAVPENEIIDAISVNILTLISDIEIILAMPSATPVEILEESEIEGEDLEKLFGEVSEIIEKFDSTLVTVSGLLSQAEEWLETYTDSIPEEGKIWIVDAELENKILQSAGEISTDLDILAETSKYLYNFTDNSEELKALSESAKIAQLIKDAIAKGVASEAGKKELVSSLETIYENLKTPMESIPRIELYKEIGANVKKGPEKESGITYDQRLEFIVGLSDVVKDTETAVATVRENTEQLTIHLGDAKSDSTSPVPVRVRKPEETKNTAADILEKAEKLPLIRKAITAGVENFAKMRKDMQKVVTDISKKPIDFKKLGDELVDITTDYSGLISDGITQYGNIIEGNYQYKDIAGIMDRFREALADIISDFPEFVSGKLMGKELKGLGKDLLKGFGGILGNLFGKSKVPTNLGQATASGYY